MSENALLYTPLYDLHLELGARMVPFAGYAMPVHYPQGILQEHLHTRSAAGLFDVSHMGQILLSGPQAAQALERLVPVDVQSLAINRQRYAVFTNAEGGVLDDLMIVRRAQQEWLLVVNAACKQADFAHLQQQIGALCQVEWLAERALLALQGPQAVTALARLNPAVAELRFMQAAALELLGVECFITRSGYTGEDGFEISVPHQAAVTLARRLLQQPEVAPIGLGARDSLRLEAGLCLYGHELSPSITPVEANLQWALSKARRAEGERAGGYPGAEVIMAQLAHGTTRQRVGLRPDGRAPVRDGTALYNAQQQSVGTVCSGGFGPSVGAPVAMAYVESAYSAVGTALFAEVRGKRIPVTVSALPFVRPRYQR